MKRNLTGICLVVIILIGAILRFYHLTGWMQFYSDQSWFYENCRDNLFSGKFPLISIGSSISWIHQGALWEYLLIPALVISGFNPVSGGLLTAVMGILCLPLAYYLLSKIFNQKSALIGTFILAVYSIPVILSRLAYHNSPIILFCLVFFLLLLTRRNFISGLFLGFLYQLHILAVILIPFAYLFLVCRKAPFRNFSLGLFIGILPFLIVGPLQTFGIIFWLIRFIFHPIPVTAAGFSISYSAILFIPLLIPAAKLLSFIPSKHLLLLGAVFLLWNTFELTHYHFLLPSVSPDFSLSKQIQISQEILKNSRVSSPKVVVLGGLENVNTYSASYRYLLWWLQRGGVKYRGKYSEFIIDEKASSLVMLQ